MIATGRNARLMSFGGDLGWITVGRVSELPPIKKTDWKKLLADIADVGAFDFDVTFTPIEDLVGALGLVITAAVCTTDGVDLFVRPR